MSRKFSRSGSASLKSRILLGIGSILFLFAIVIGLNFYIITTIPTQKTGTSGPSASKVKGAATLVESFLTAQNSANEFLLYSDMAEAEEHKTIVNNLLAKVQQVKNNASKRGNSADVASADKILSLIQSYSNTFQELANAKTARGKDSSSGLQGQLSTASQKFFSIVSRNEAGNLALALLEIQARQKSYFKKHNGKTLRNLTSAIKNLERFSRESKIDPLDAQMLRKNIKKYSSALDRYQAVSLATNDPSLSSTLDKEQERQADAMRSAAEEIVSIITRVNVSNTINLAINVRQQQEEYLLHGTESSVSQFDKALDTLINAFNGSSILQEHKNELVKISIVYRDVFKKLVEKDVEINNLTAQLDNATTSLASQIESVSTTMTSPVSSASGKIPAETNQLAYIAIIAGFIVILIGLIVAFQIGNSISTPITSITTILKRIIRDKEYTVEIPVSGQNEIGDLAVELNNLLQLQQNVSHEAVEKSDSLSKSMNVFLDNLNNLNTHILNISDNSLGITDFTAGQNETTKQVNNTIKELTATAEGTQQVIKQTNEQNILVASAIDELKTSIEKTLEGIKSITQSSSEISDIINLSTDIAEQTNLLALNASVKAARAGSHGKEFAHIADEIAKLAQRSEDVAKDAKKLTSDLSLKVDGSLNISNEIEKPLSQILEIGKNNVSSAQELTSQSEALTSCANLLTQQMDKLTSAIREISTTAQDQSSECALAQETVSNLIEKASSPQNLSGEDEGEPDLSMKELIDNMEISMKENEGTVNETEENNIVLSSVESDNESEQEEDSDGKSK